MKSDGRSPASATWDKKIGGFQPEISLNPEFFKKMKSDDETQVFKRDL
jgi:hypothetical protein